MKAIKQSTDDDEGSGRLAEALRKARLAQAAHFDALVEIRDASTLRLQVLKDEIEPIIREKPHLTNFIDLALLPGDPPRLWLDLTSYVTMAPDPRTFRLVRDTTTGHDILLETTDRAEMVRKLTEFAAHRAVERQRALADVEIRQADTVSGDENGGTNYGKSALILAWLSGFSLGVLALLAMGVWLAKIS